MKIPIKDFVLKILQEQGLPTTTASKQLGKTYNKLVGKSREKKKKGIPPENNASLQEVLYKSRQPHKAKPSSIVLNNIKNEGKIAEAQIKNQA